MSTTFLHGESGCACSRNTCKGCITYETYKTVKTPTTNADCIRAMSDDELAEWINQHDCHTNLYGYDPKDAILDWLKREADDDTDRE